MLPSHFYYILRSDYILYDLIGIKVAKNGRVARNGPSNYHILNVLIFILIVKSQDTCSLNEHVGGKSSISIKLI